MSCSHTLFRLLIILLFSNSSRALDPRVRHHIEGHIDAPGAINVFKRFKLRDEPGATRSDKLKQQFLDLGSAGLGTYLGGVLQGVVHEVDDMLGNEWSLPHLMNAAAANATSNTKYVVAQ
jgi:hypothetical protein